MNAIERAGPKSVILPEPVFDHLSELTTPIGLWEHADHVEPRPEHGFCTDDNARGLIVLLREASDEPELREMEEVFRRFISAAAITGGGFHNRRLTDGAWGDTIGSDDSQGRAIWALGTDFRRARNAQNRSDALNLFERLAFESKSPRANAFAVLGASEVLAAHPGNVNAVVAIAEWASHLHMVRGSDWPWPEARLAYENARLPEAMITAGNLLDDDAMIDDGLSLLRWLVAVEKSSDHQFSFTPVGGWAPGEIRPGFDQQPTEAAAMADACARAWSVSGDASWLDEVERAGEWLVGANDRRAMLYDAGTGGCFDGLSENGPNLNQGAESTLAALSILQQTRELRLSAGSPTPGPSIRMHPLGKRS